MSLKTIESELISARPYFETISPGVLSALRGRALRATRVGLVALSASRQFRKVNRGEKAASDVVGELIAGQAMRKALTPLRMKITSVHIIVNTPRPHYLLDPKNPYMYTDAEGTELFRVRRKGGAFIQEHPTPTGWRPGRNKTPDVLYKFPELLSRPDEPVFVVEGEKDVNRLHEEGLLAVTNPGGAGKWKDEYSAHLRGRDVIIIPDNDAIGQRHASQVAKSVQNYTRTARIVRLPGLGHKEDVYDWLEHGNNRESLLQKVNAADDVSHGMYDLIFYSMRSTPQVVGRGEKPQPKEGYGDITLRRPATQTEENFLQSGKWLRVDEDGNKPKHPNYKKTRYRPELVKDRT